MPNQPAKNEKDTQFDELITTAKRNEELLKKFQSYEIELIEAGTLSELFEKLFRQENLIFSDCNTRHLILIDPDNEINKLLNQADIDLDEYKYVELMEDENYFGNIFDDGFIPVLDKYYPSLYKKIFGDSEHKIASIAILPLVRNQQLLGCYLLGSQYSNRFKKEVATDFIQHLSTIIALCIENCLSKEKVRILGLIDNLTGVNNRRYFDDRLSEEILRFKRNNSDMSCLFADIDYFKHINDTYGHQIGDKILKHVATIIKKEVRNIDIVARYGGEEFVVVLIDSGNEMAVEVAERIRKDIENTVFNLENGSLKITVSFGVHTLSQNDKKETLNKLENRLVTEADKALYIAKNNGRNRTVNSNQNRSGENN